MKRILLLLPLFFSLYGFGQQQLSTARLRPAIIIDSALVNENYFKYLLAEDIARVDVKRDEAEFKDGVIYITTKNKLKTDSLLKSPLRSLKDIVKANIPLQAKQKPIIFLLDGVLLTDTLNVHIPALAIRKVTIKKSADMPYFKTALPKVIMLIIATKPPVTLVRGYDQE